MARSRSGPVLGGLLLVAASAAALTWWSDESAAATFAGPDRASKGATHEPGTPVVVAPAALELASTRAAATTDVGGHLDLAQGAPGLPPRGLDVRVVDVDGQPVGGVVVWGEAVDALEELLASVGEESLVFFTSTSTRLTADASSPAEVDGSGRASKRLTTLRSASSGDEDRISDSFGRLDPESARRFDITRREAVLRAPPLQTDAEGRARLRLGHLEAERGRFRVHAGGPHLPPVDATVRLEDPPADGVVLTLPPFGSLVVELEDQPLAPGEPEPLVVAGRLTHVPDNFAASVEPLPRAPLVLPLVAVGAELDVHVRVLEDGARVAERTPRPPDPDAPPPDPWKQGLVDFDLVLAGVRSVAVLDLAGATAGRVEAGELRAPRVTRVAGPRVHGERHVVSVPRGELRVALRGTLVDDEAWNIGGFTATFAVETRRDTHRFQDVVDDVGGFRLVLPPDVASDGPRRLTITGNPSALRDRYHEVSVDLGTLAPGPNDLGALMLRPLPPLVSGHVLDPLGQPVAGAVLALYERATDATGEPVWRELPGPPAGLWRSDRTGSFELLGNPGDAPLAVHVRAAVEAGAEPVPFQAPVLGLTLVVPGR